MLYALFALILIPVGLNDLGSVFLMTIAGIWMAPPRHSFPVLCVMMALHLPMGRRASVPIEGGVAVWFCTPTYAFDPS